MARKNIRCFYQNTRGLRIEIVKGLRNKITLANHDIIGLTETWLYDQIDSESIFNNSYITYRADRTNRTYTTPIDRRNDNYLGGGALIAIKNNISAIRLKSWEFEVPFDNIWLKINTTGSSKNINKLYLYQPSIEIRGF